MNAERSFLFLEGEHSGSKFGKFVRFFTSWKTILQTGNGDQCSGDREEEECSLKSDRSYDHAEVGTVYLHSL